MNEDQEPLIEQESEIKLETISEPEDAKDPQPSGATSEDAGSSPDPAKDREPAPGMSKKKRVTIQDLSSSSSDSDEALIRSSATSSTQPSYRQALQYRLYPWRWFMLATLCLLNVSNGTVGRDSKL